MINERLEAKLQMYEIKDVYDAKNALREIGQLIVLSALARTNFFSYYCFYGGTSLRLLRHLSRFSEDLDFVKYNENPCNIDLFISAIINEFASLGIQAEIENKNKNIETSVLTLHVKTIYYPLFTNSNILSKFKISKDEKLSLKIDLDSFDIKGGNLEYLPLSFPHPFKVLTYDISTLFACKLMVVLTRGWKNRVKGRDYYDYLFYISLDVKPNYTYLSNGLNIDVDKEKLKELLLEKFNSVDFLSAYNDVISFTKETNLKEMFNKEYFIDTLSNL